MKKLLAILFCALLVLSCGAYAQGETVKYGACVVGVDDYSNAILKGARDVCEEFGWEFYEYSAEYDVQKQVNCIESAIASGVQGMFIQDLDFVSVAPVIKKALDAGMVIVVPGSFRDYMDDYVDHENLFYVAWDEEELGYVQASRLFEMMDEREYTNVYCIAGTQGRIVVTNRVNGFLRALEEHPNITNINTVYIDNDDRAKGTAAAEDALISNPELQAVFTMNEGIGWGTYEACENADRTDVLIALSDYSTTTREMMLEGKIAVSGVDGPPYIGSAAGAKLLKAKLEGQPIDDVVDWYDFDKHEVLSTNIVIDWDTAKDVEAFF